jgi:hypothetical protein
VIFVDISAGRVPMIRLDRKALCPDFRR